MSTPDIITSKPCRDRATFEFLLEGVITNAQVAREAAKGLSIFDCQARDIARQRRMNQMVDNQIIQLEEMFNIFVACTRNDEMHRVPMPPTIDRERTMLNFDNSFGASLKQKADASAVKSAAMDAAWEAAKRAGEAARKAKRKGGKGRI